MEYKLKECQPKSIVEANLIESFKMFGFNVTENNDKFITFRMNLKNGNTLTSKINGGGVLNEIESTVVIDKAILKQYNVNSDCKDIDPNIASWNAFGTDYMMLNTINYFARVWLWDCPLSWIVLLKYYTKVKTLIRLSKEFLSVNVGFYYCKKPDENIKQECNLTELFTLSFSMKFTTKNGEFIFCGVSRFTFTVNNESIPSTNFLFTKKKIFNVGKIISKLNDLITDPLKVTVDKRFINFVNILLSVTNSSVDKGKIKYAGNTIELDVDGTNIVIKELPGDFLMRSDCVPLVQKIISSSPFMAEKK